MIIKNHLLFQDDGQQVSFHRSPNRGNRLKPKYLIMHYTAGSNADGSINWLCNKQSKASAHVVIARDGKVTQLLPFNVIAWHAGESFWNGYDGLNKYSIGIELDNDGKLSPQSNRWISPFGAVYDDSQVLSARHKNDGEMAGWLLYPEKQIKAALEVGLALQNYYIFSDVLGHDDISPGRKTDPGPAFPMSNYKSAVMGRMADHHPVLQTTVNLNIRKSPDLGAEKLPESPLPAGTKVELLSWKGIWRFVDVTEPLEGNYDIQGWVHGKYLREV